MLHVVQAYSGTQAVRVHNQFRTTVNNAEMAYQCTFKPMGTARVVPGVTAQRRCVRAKAAQEVTGMVFQPFSEVQSELSTVNDAPVTQSYARVDYDPKCEAAINEQINIEYTISYVYHALHSYFARDNVGLPGFAKFFGEASEEERGHAQLLMDYQVKRGGRVELKVCLKRSVGRYAADI